MTISSIIWQNVKVEVPELKKSWSWDNCMILYNNGSMSIRRMEHGVESGDSLVLGTVEFQEITPWRLMAEAKAAFDDKLCTAFVHAKF